MTRPDSRALPVLPMPAAPAPTGSAPRDVEVPADAVRVAMVTLGCDKNSVDSERILGSLLGAGVRLTASPEDADVVVVNTCGFIEMAKEESIDTLLEAARLKERGRVRAVVGMGCLVQRYRSDLEREIPEVDLFLGLTDADRLLPELTARGLIPEPADDGPLMERPLRILSGGPTHSSHLKISEGCDHGCAFCAIPLMRGKFRSTPIDRLVAEARELETRGVVELNIVSQDTTWYGRDWARALARGDTAALEADVGGWFMGRPFEGMPNLRAASAWSTESEAAAAAAAVRSSSSASAAESAPPAEPRGPVTPKSKSKSKSPLERIGRRGALPLLLRTLLDETSVPWLRLFYMYPSGITDELVELLAAEPRLLPYLDMPIQHGSDSVLARMRRPERSATIRERVHRLRSAVLDLALRTTVIVGFPGETEEEFEALLELLEELRFDHVGAFAYSDEEETAAASMPDPVPEPVRRERLERVLDLTRTLAYERNAERVGSRATVLVDRVEDGVALARGPWQGPEVDGAIRIEDGAGLAPGRFVTIQITDADEQDLTGVVAGEEIGNG